MRVDAELLVLPYAARDGGHLLDRLIAELESDNWTEFRAAVAFGRRSGNFPDLLEALRTFAEAGHEVTITFSAQEFGEGAYATDYETVEGLLDHLEAIPSASVHLYREPGRTFHPKIYLFANEESALLIVGSSNWGEGGLVTNIEANVVLRMNLQDDETRQQYECLVGYFQRFWTE